MTASRRALAVGKFWPPHRGHHELIGSLSARCDDVVVLVCATDRQRPGGLERALWLQHVHPRAEVIVVHDLCDHHAPHPCPPSCTPLWAEVVRHLHVGPIDLVASCEEYGPRFADALGAGFLALERWPSSVGGDLSATAVRSDLRRHWFDLDPVVRSGLFRRVVVLGAESTGTTTLASDLAGRLGAPLVPEVGRTVSWVRYAETGDMDAVVWDAATFWMILDRQARAESMIVAGVIDAPPVTNEPWLVCDTDSLATVAWWERYLSEPSDAALDFATARLADVYLLTDPDGVDFESDPVRDGREIRRGMHGRFMELLDATGVEWHLVSGSPASRLDQAVKVVVSHMAQRPIFAR